MPSKRPPRWLHAARAAGAAGGDWIGRVLPRAGILPPNEVDDAIRAGRVSIDGKTVTDAFTPVRLGQQIQVDGAAASIDAPTLALMFHKPGGIVVAASDAQGTVFEALARVLPLGLRRYGWHAIGRLDRETTGLLLFSNDERLVAHVTSPDTGLAKTYVATTDGRVSDEQAAALVAGVMIEDGEAKALSARKRGANEIEVIITEGRHHQVRRMLNAVRLGIRRLHRESIGSVALDVPGGAFRQLAVDEIAQGLRVPWLATDGAQSN